MGTAISEMSWPATSSMTAKEGSAIPLSTATVVQVGTPIMTTNAAASVEYSHKFSGEVRCAASHHKPTVAAEAHVPGPGLRNPIPKNVANSQEKCERCALGGGAAGLLTAPLTLVWLLLRVFMFGA